MSVGQPPVLSSPRALPVSRTCPVSLLCVIASVVLFLVAADFDQSHPGDRYGGQGRYGALTALRMVADRELHGLFQFWGDRRYEGDWWRLLTTGFHHGGLVHLLLNCLGMIYLGRLLEPRLGRLKFLLFFCTAIVVANIPHVILNEGVVGLSGGLYAVFGMLLPLRKTDEEVAEKLNDGTVLIGLLWIPVGMLLTATDVFRIGNAAHLTGLIYGWLAGRAVFSPRFAGKLWTPRVFVAAHAVLIPALMLAANPVWNGRYHWYRAVKTANDDQRIAHLQAAVACNPRLSGAWRMLADSYRLRDAHDDKWRTAFQAVKHGRTDDKCLGYVNAMWMETTPADRERALKALRETFPREEWEMRKQLGLFTPPTLPPYRHIPRNGYATLRILTPHPWFDHLFWSPVDGRRVATPLPLTAPPVDPHRPDSAAVGELL